MGHRVRPTAIACVVADRSSGSAGRSIDRSVDRIAALIFAFVGRPILTRRSIDRRRWPVCPPPTATDEPLLEFDRPVAVIQKQNMALGRPRQPVSPALPPPPIFQVVVADVARRMIPSFAAPILRRATATVDGDVELALQMKRMDGARGEGGHRVTKMGKSPSNECNSMDEGRRWRWRWRVCR